MGKGKWRIKHRFVPIELPLIDSPVYVELTGADLKVYIRAYLKSWRSPDVLARFGYPDGVTLTDGDFKHLMSHETLVGSRRRLVRLGLLEYVMPSNLMLRKAALYRVSERWRTMTQEQIRKALQPKEIRPAPEVVLPGKSNTVSENQTPSPTGLYCPVEQEKAKLRIQNARFHPVGENDTASARLPEISRENRPDESER